jgi:hypothetical protein
MFEKFISPSTGDTAAPFTESKINTYRKRQHKILLLSLMFIMLGIGAFAAYFIMRTESFAQWALVKDLDLAYIEEHVTNFYKGFGIGLTFVGIAFFISSLRALSNKERLLAAEISAGDERNRLLQLRTASIAGTLTMLAAAIVIFVQPVAALVLSQVTCFYLLVYLICYFIMSRKY